MRQVIRASKHSLPSILPKSIANPSFVLKNVTYQ